MLHSPRSFALVLLGALPGLAQDGAKSDLQVLFVGQDPKNPVINYEPTERMVELHRERTGAYAALLQAHFNSVEVVFAAEYEVSMSDRADVTVFDARPPVLEGEDAEDYSALRLPKSFTRPALMVAEIASDLGGPLGLKLDWL